MRDEKPKTTTMLCGSVRRPRRTAVVAECAALTKTLGSAKTRASSAPFRDQLDLYAKAS